MNMKSGIAVRAGSAVTVAIALLIGLVGCNGMRNPEDFPLDGPTRTAESNPSEVSAEDFGHSWNLEVDHGSVACEINSSDEPVLTFTSPDGTVYALNAVEENTDLPDIGDILDGSIGPLRTYAFTVCDA